MKIATFSILLVLVSILNGNAQETNFLNNYSASELHAFNFKKANGQLYANKLSISNYSHIAKEVDEEKKLSKGKREKNAGITLMCLGGAFLAGAIATGIISTKDNSSDATTKNLILRGSALGAGALSGVFIGVGLPLTIVGVHRVRKFGK